MGKDIDSGVENFADIRVASEIKLVHIDYKSLLYQQCMIDNLHCCKQDIFKRFTYIMDYGSFDCGFRIKHV